MIHNPMMLWRAQSDVPGKYCATWPAGGEKLAGRTQLVPADNAFACDNEAHACSCSRAAKADD